MRTTFQGSIVAMVTPFKDGRVDEAKLRELVEFHVTSGTDGIVPCGTTGESPTLSHDEHKRVVEIVVETARGRLPVIAGTGSNSTAEAIDLTRHAAKAGASGALVVNPYYNKPTQEGLYQHFRAVAECADLPIILYNIAGRTAINVETDTLARLARDCKNLVGDWKHAREMHLKLFPLSRAVFIETNPIPVKEAMAMMGMVEPEFRLPMCRMGAVNRERLRTVLV